MDQTKDCTRELIAKAHNNDKEAREKLVTDNLGLIWNIIKRFKGRGTEQEDLFQIGCIGLIKAIDNFNLDMDVAFSTYAVPMITGEIRRFLRDDGMVKVSRSIKENAVKSMRAAGQLRDRRLVLHRLQQRFVIPDRHHDIRKAGGHDPRLQTVGSVVYGQTVGVVQFGPFLRRQLPDQLRRRRRAGAQHLRSAAAGPQRDFQQTQ